LFKGALNKQATTDFDGAVARCLKQKQNILMNCRNQEEAEMLYLVFIKKFRNHDKVLSCSDVNLRIYFKNKSILSLSYPGKIICK